MTNKILIIMGLLLFLFAGTLYYLENTEGGSLRNFFGPNDSGYVNDTPREDLLGGDVDEYGCIGSAGYSWCELKNKCLRVWEEACVVETPPLSEEEEDVYQAKKIACEEDSGTWYGATLTCERNFLSASECSLRGGVWNGCDSACRHDPSAEFCSENCVQTCTFR